MTRKSGTADELDNRPGKRKRRPQRRGAAGKPKRPALGERGREEWARIVRELEQQGRLSAVDATLIADHCLVVERIDQAEKAIGEMGLLIQGERGWVKNPAVQMARDYRDRMHKGLQLLGLDPGRRDAIAQAADEDPEGLLD